MVDYERYERECKLIREQNAVILEAFSVWLRAKGLSDATIRRHVDNIDLYINMFLLYEEATPARDGVYGYSVSGFLGYWFIRKAMWASETSIRSNAASIKKFYRYMYEAGEVGGLALAALESTIKERLPDWLATWRRYDDPTIEDPAEIWGY